MSRRKTVKLNMGFCFPKIREVCRSNIVFCEKMGRGRNWVTEWKRNRNLPSPEEAARMCVILQVRPEEILTEQDDIELVSKLLESQKEKPLAHGKELSDVEMELIRLYDLASPELQAAALAVLKSAEAADNIPGVHSTKQ